jgi:hypothetical protein
MPAFDANLMTRTTGNLTTTESSSGVILRGTGVKGMSLRVAVPTAYNDNDTLTCQVWDSDDDSTYALLAQRAYTGLKSAPGSVYVAVVTEKKYAKSMFIPSTTTAANANFGAVKSGFVEGVAYNWSRAEGFE